MAKYLYTTVQDSRLEMSTERTQYFDIFSNDSIDDDNKGANSSWSACVDIRKLLKAVFPCIDRIGETRDSEESRCFFYTSTGSNDASSL